MYIYIYIYSAICIFLSSIRYTVDMHSECFLSMTSTFGYFKVFIFISIDVYFRRFFISIDIQVWLF